MHWTDVIPAAKFYQINPEEFMDRTSTGDSLHRPLAPAPTHRSQRPLYFNAPELRKVGQLLDVGGGPGFVASLLKEECPRIKITVFDLAAVCERALNIFRESSQGHDLGAHAGDFFHDPFPSGFKAIQLSHVLESLPPERIYQLLKKSFDALPRAGKLFLYGHARKTEEADYLRWLAAIGFSKIRCRRDTSDKIFLTAVR